MRYKPNKENLEPQNNLASLVLLPVINKAASGGAYLNPSIGEAGELLKAQGQCGVQCKTLSLKNIIKIKLFWASEVVHPQA